MNLLHKIAVAYRFKSQIEFYRSATIMCHKTNKHNPTYTQQSSIFIIFEISHCIISRYPTSNCIGNNRRKIDSITMTISKHNTTMDKQMESALLASTTGELIAKDAVEVLEEIDTVLRDETSSNSKRMAASRSIRKLLVPLLQASGSGIIQASQSLCPIASVGYAQRRKQTKKKREQKGIVTEEFVSEAERNIFFYLEEKRLAKEGNDDNEESPPKKKPRHSVVVTPSASPPPPPQHSLSPSVDRAYNKVEAAKMLSSTKKNTRARGRMMNGILAHQQAYNSPCCLRTLQRLMKDFDDGRLIYGEFTDAGRPPFASDEELEAALKHFQQHNGKTLARDDVKEIICKVRNERGRCISILR